MDLGSSSERPQTEYKYKTIEDHQSIRLLLLLPGEFNADIHFKLEHILLADNPQYEALSYVWGDASQTFEVFCDGNYLRITKSLHSALRHLRHPTVVRTLWADAICINQQDNAEKSIQVQLMGLIYSHASQVLIWIGEDTDDLSYSFRVLQSMHQFLLQNEKDYPFEELTFENMGDSSSPIFTELYTKRDMWSGPVLQILHQTWFTRRWIIQEVGKARKATIICGLKTLPWEILANVYWSLFRCGVLGHIIEPGEPDLVISSIANLELIRRDSQKKEHAPLLESVISTRGFQCTNSRDVVYSIIGLAGDAAEYGDSIIPDYSLSVAEVYKKFVTGCIMNKGSLYPLSVLYVPPKSGALDLPSWVADFDGLEKENPLIRMRMGNGFPFRASGTTTQKARISDDGNLLHVWGKVVDVVVKIAPGLHEIPFLQNTELQETELIYRRDNEWLTACKDIASGGNGVLSPERFEAFWRTMVFNLTTGADRPPLEYGTYFQHYLDRRFGTEGAISEEEYQARSTNIPKVEGAILTRLASWRFCETKNGRLGQVLKSAKVGDVICILYGGELPYVIRPIGDGKYKFVASAYVHGLMDGEACGMEELEETELCLC